MLYETARLTLREFEIQDAPFILELLNTQGWLQFIGDRGVKSIEDAQDYLAKKVISSYQKFGFGLYLVVLKENSLPIGMCGLVKRDTLENPDIGFAFLPAFVGKGYAREAAEATLAYTKDTLKIQQLLAITSHDNINSIALLEKIGFRFDKMTDFADESESLKLFVWQSAS